MPETEPTIVLMSIPSAANHSNSADFFFFFFLLRVLFDLRKTTLEQLMSSVSSLFIDWNYVYISDTRSQYTG